ncbi:hypothetical protein QBC46DRAFT_421296 [Diplogelasinospora grovesii]|uniref:Nucleoside phosphorylase domain-containing protein n=1 Tax=Diplogelasinospora grovesii TaxID=303347 RepID=A0AAN6MYD3_9PEZI|nr:hypothetical protein QBC46DRAFT_421296 [Diplogelasinospora grovesii]
MDDDGPLYDKAASDRNAYSTGAIGRYNIVLAYMPGIGMANAAAVAANLGIYGAVPFNLNSAEIVLSDVIISDGVVQYDFGQRLLKRFMRKDTLLNSLSKLNIKIRALLIKLFKATYRYVVDRKLCVKCGCNSPLIPRNRLDLVASGNTVIKSGEERDTITRAWDSFPCVVIKGAYDYADSYKTNVWQRYAAATAAACIKAFLNH